MSIELNKKIRQTILSLLKESSLSENPLNLYEKDAEDSEVPSEEEKPQKKKAKKKKKAQPGEIITTGAFGSGGRAKGFVASAKARAESDPEGLLEDLGIKGGVGGGDLQQVQSIINSAIHSNLVMSDAYAGARLNKDQPANLEQPVDAVLISMGALDRKNGVRFMAHTLVAAQNAGVLNLQGALQFAQGNTADIIIYSI